MKERFIDWNRNDIEKIPNELGVYWLFDEKNQIIQVIRSYDIRKSALNCFERISGFEPPKIKTIGYKLFGKLEDAMNYQIELETFLWYAKIFDRHENDIKKIIEYGELYHVALVMTVTALETFLRDKFKEVRYSRWFITIGSEIDFRKRIIEIVREVGKEDEFLRMVFIEKPDTRKEIIDILYNLLFPTENKEPLINFQLFKGKPGAVWAYKQFLDIDLQERLNTNWDTFLTYINMRHKIIHGSKKPIDTLINKSDAEKALALTTELKTYIDVTLESPLLKWL